MGDRRICEGCGEPLEPGSRPDQRHHDGACRTAAYRQRRRHQEGREVSVGIDLLSPEVQALLKRALAEPRLVAAVSAGARSNWRAAAWSRTPVSRALGLRGRPVEPDDASAGDDPFREVDELAARRRRRDG